LILHENVQVELFSGADLRWPHPGNGASRLPGGLIGR
jgi:hypothetical protein